MQAGIGLDLAREYRPDLILADMELPDMSPEAFLVRLRSQDALQTTPLILLSADSGDSSLEVLAQQHGASCLRKPYAPEELLDIIHSSLQHSNPL